MPPDRRFSQKVQYDVQTREKLLLVEHHPGEPLSKVQSLANEHVKPITGLAFSPSGRFLASSSQDGTIKVRELPSGRILRTLRGHSGAVNAVAYSPDGLRLATAGQDDWMVLLWPVDQPEEPRTFPLPISTFGLAMSPLGDQVVVAGYERDALPQEKGAEARHGLVTLIDTKSGRWLHQIRAGKEGTTGVAYHPKGLLLATADRDGSVAVWALKDGTKFASPRCDDNVFSVVAFSADGHYLAAGGGKGKGPGRVRVWESETWKVVLDRPGPAGGVSSIAFHQKEPLLAVLAWEGELNVVEVPGGQVRRTIHTPCRTANRVVFSPPDGKSVAVVGGLESNPGAVSFSGEGESGVILYETETGRERYRIAGHGWITVGLAFSPDGRRIATSGWNDSLIQVWDASNGRYLLTIQGEGRDRELGQLAFTPDGNWLISAGGVLASKVNWWDGTPRYPAHRLAGVTLGQGTLTFNAKGTGLAAVGNSTSPEARQGVPAGTWEGWLTQWDIGTGKTSLRLPFANHFFTRVSFRADDREIALSTNGFGPAPVSPAVRILDPKNGVVLRTLSARQPGVYAPKGNLLATGAEDKHILIWDQDGKIPIKKLGPFAWPVYSLVFSPDSTLLAGSFGSKVIIWNTQTWKEVCTFTGHTQSLVVDLAFSPDGRRIVSAGNTPNLKIPKLNEVILNPPGEWLLWTVDLEPKVLARGFHPSGCQAVAFIEDGKAILSLGGQEDGNGELRLWDARSSDQLSTSGRTHFLAQAIAALAVTTPGAPTFTLPPTVVGLGVATSDVAPLRGSFRLSSRTTSMAFSRDGRWVSLGLLDKVAELWEVRVLLSRISPVGSRGGQLHAD